MSSDSHLSAGETVIGREKFSPSPVLFWVKTELVVTEKRISGTVPNTLLGIIPLGSSNMVFPLKQVSGLGVNNKVKPLRLALGALLVIIALSTFGDTFVGGLLLLVLGVSLFLGGLTAALQISNNAGVTQDIVVTMFEKTRLEAFANKARGHLLDL